MKRPLRLYALVLLTVAFFGGCSDADPEPDAAADVVEETAAADTEADAAVDAAADTPADTTPPVECAPLDYDFQTLIPGPCEAGHDADLAALALRYDRSFHALSAVSTGGNADVHFDLALTDERAAIEAFLADDDGGWDLADHGGVDALASATHTGKTTGLYAGVGIAADAYRYAVLRDQGYPEAEVARARGHVVDGMELLHTATAITGISGGLARAVARTDIPGAGQSVVVPLFDDAGAALPEPKNNGTWRADNSEGGQYPGLIWEDSCSRDMALGWVTAYGAIWEAIADDPTFDAADKTRLQADAKAIGEHFQTVRANGYDLELHDPDGRRTQHGCFHEFNIDCGPYSELLRNGFHAFMAIGMVSTLAYVSDDAGLKAYVQDDLIDARNLPGVTLDDLVIDADLGHKTNFSGINMIFGGALLAIRYVPDPAARADLRQALVERVYFRKEQYPWHPEDMSQSLFDIVYAAAITEGSVFSAPAVAPPAEALTRGIATLNAFPAPPFWNHATVNCPDVSCTCDEKQIPEAQKTCVLADGTSLELLGCVGWNCELVSRTPVPKALRSPSNYEWRSNPYRVNGGGNGQTLMPGVDFRFAYWLGRFLRQPAP